jgi:hypothetical protein
MSAKRDGEYGTKPARAEEQRGVQPAAARPVREPTTPPSGGAGTSKPPSGK